MITIFYTYVLEFKGSDGFNQYWCTLIPALELAYKMSIHFSMCKTPEILEKGWNPKLPYDILKKDLVDIPKTESGFKISLEKERHHANGCMQNSFRYARTRWDKSHKPPDFKGGDLVLVSTPKFNNIKGPQKLKDSFAVPFMIRALHGPNSVQLRLTGDFMKKKLFPLRNEPPLKITPLEEVEENKILKFLKKGGQETKK
ncbi:hypothetical protein O181_010399 [Austropuccinia psidii MF-1]|uniref:Uncharacterized protein n=1 Tax=Austropuccinia psidii MF-1 TaxID=1389203 RepID=A0A9Q3BQZ9_9BASI|nr:hypothetical protein [Austropuccinia psidii MF-1]